MAKANKEEFLKVINPARVKAEEKATGQKNRKVIMSGGVFSLESGKTWENVRTVLSNTRVE